MPNTLTKVTPSPTPGVPLQFHTTHDKNVHTHGQPLRVEYIQYDPANGMAVVMGDANNVVALGNGEGEVIFPSFGGGPTNRWMLSPFPVHVVAKFYWWLKNGGQQALDSLEFDYPAAP